MSSDSRDIGVLDEVAHPEPLVRPLAVAHRRVLLPGPRTGSPLRLNSVSGLVSKHGIESCSTNQNCPFHNPADRRAESPTASRSLSEQTLEFEEISLTSHADTEFKLKRERHSVRA